MNTKVFVKAQEHMAAIQCGIANKLYAGFKGYNETDGWGGADVLVTTKQPQNQSPGFYPDARMVVTQYAHEAGWLFTKLWELFSGHDLLDSCSKIEFFGRLANAAIRYQKKLNGRQETEEEFLTAIFDEATKILNEMSKGDFECLTVAPGGVIAADVK